MDTADDICRLLRNERTDLPCFHAKEEASGFGIGAEVGDLWIVAIEQNSGRFGKVFQHSVKRSGDRIEFAVAIQLIAENVGDDHDIRLNFWYSQRDRALVDLEEQYIAIQPTEKVGGVHRHGGHALKQIGACTVL